MSYRERPPDPRLARWVESLRFSSDDDAESSQRMHRIVPDGCLDLLVSIPSCGGDLSAEVFGPKSKARLVGGDGPRENAAVHFRAGMASRLLGVAAHELVDRSVDLASLWPDAGPALAERLAVAPDEATRGRLLERALLERLRETRERDASRERLVAVAVARIRQRRGSLPIRALAAELGVGERRLERLFRAELGLPPKTFSRIARLHAALAGLRAGLDQARVAHACGYSDQPHLLRDFRALTGQTPRAYLAPASS